MKDLIYYCDGCGRKYEYLKIIADLTVSRNIERIRPLILMGEKEYCRACAKKIKEKIAKMTEEMEQELKEKSEKTAS